MKIYIKPYCPHCIRLLSLLDSENVEYEVIDIIKSPEQGVIMQKISGHTGVPQVAIKTIIIYDYGTEETLVADILSLIKSGDQEEDIRKNLTSQFTSLV